MKRLLIVGAGGYGQLVGNIASDCGYEYIDYLDDSSVLACGTFSDISKVQDSYDGCVVAVGNPKLREKLYCLINRLVTLIHPTAWVSNSVVIGNGCVIEAKTVVNNNSIIKDSVFVCAGAVINHDSVIGSYSQIDCNAVVSAGSIVEPYTKIDSCMVFK